MKALVAFSLCAISTCSAQCSTTLGSPPPNGLVCEQTGQALVSKKGLRQFQTKSFESCRDNCLNDPNCKSFSFLPGQLRCRIHGTETHTKQIGPISPNKLVFSNRACYERIGFCNILSQEFGDFDYDGTAHARPTQGSFGTQLAQIHPWAVFYGLNDTESTVKYAHGDFEDAYAEITVVWSETLGLVQNVVFNPADQQGSYGTLLRLSFLSYDGETGAATDDVYNLLIYYRSMLVRKLQIVPDKTAWSRVNDPGQNYAYGASFLVEFRRELTSLINDDSDATKPHQYGIYLPGPDGDVANEAVFGIYSMEIDQKTYADLH